MAGEDVEVTFGAQLEGLQAGIEEAKEQIEGLTEPISGVTEAFSGLAEAAGVAFAVDKIAEFAAEMGELGEQTERTAAVLGLSTQQVGELQYAFAATGTPVQNLDLMMSRFELTLQRAAQGTGPARAGLQALGLSAKELIGIPLPQQLEKLSEAVSKFGDSTNKTAALATLGRGMVELIPLFDEGADAITEFGKQAERAGAVLDTEMTKRLADMEHGFKQAEVTIKGTTISAFAPLISVVKSTTSLFTDLVLAMGDSVRQGGDLGQIMSSLATGMKYTLEAAVLLASGIRDIGTWAAASFNIANEAGQGFGKAMRQLVLDIAHGWSDFWAGVAKSTSTVLQEIDVMVLNAGEGIKLALQGNTAAAAASFAHIGTAAGEAVDAAKNAFSGAHFDFGDVDKTVKETTDKVTTLWNQALKDTEEGHQSAKNQITKIWASTYDEIGRDSASSVNKQVGQLADLTNAHKKASNEIAKDAQQMAEAQILAAKSAADLQEQKLNELVKTHQISWGQWLSQTTAVLEQEKAAVQAAYNQEADTVGLTEQQKEAIWLKELAFVNEISKKEAEAQAKAAEESQKSWDSATKEINSAFDSQIDGLLTGTETWGEAFKKVVTKLTEDAIKFFLDLGLQQIENTAKNIVLQNQELASFLGIQATKTAAVTTSNTAQTATVITNQTTQTAAVQGAQAAQTAAVVSGASAQEAAQTSASAAGAASSIAGVLKSIGASVGQVFAGVSGFMAPLIGPAAPAAGAAAAAAVDAGSLAYLGGLYDTGSWSVPKDMIAGVHAGEMIIPAKGGIADEFRSFLSAGGFTGRGGGVSNSGGYTRSDATGGFTVAPTQHYHVNAIDTASGAEWLRNNAGKLSSVMNEAVRRGAILGQRRLGQ